MEEHHEFVRSLPIEIPPLLGVTAATTSASTDDSNAKLISGDVAIFAPDVTAENKQAVKDSMQLAQLAANNQVPEAKIGEDKTIEWYKAYGNVLLHIGWPSLAFEFDELKIDQASFTIKAQLLQILTDFVEGGGSQEKILKTVQDAFDALEKDPGGVFAKIYSHSHNKARKHAFSIGVITQDPDPDPNQCVPILNLVAVDIDADASNTTVLWTDYKSVSTHMRVAKNKLILNKVMFNKIHDTILKKLGKDADDFIANLDTSS